MFTALTGWILGVLLGMRHALEPDHLAAVSTLVAEEHNPRKGALLGAFWGVGHSAALLGVGVVLAAFHATMPSRVADIFELGVAFMLVGLGARALVRAAELGRFGPVHDHRHGLAMHHHQGPPSHVHLGRWTFATRSLAVGLVHGLAGSGALTALVLSNLPSTSSRLLYITLFGFGSVMGMALLSGMLGLPLAKLGKNPRAGRLLSGATGLLSTVLGLFWGWPIALRLVG
jgi:High-affinity nickel-transport protein